MSVRSAFPYDMRPFAAPLLLLKLLEQKLCGGEMQKLAVEKDRIAACHAAGDAGAAKMGPTG